jgi:hypothetical protein
MRNYWIKIVLGALGIFFVGMIIVTAVKSARTKITRTMESIDPIPLPVAFLPFRLDGVKLGSLSKLVLLRDLPNQVSGVDLVVSLADSVSPRRFHDCLLAVDDVEHINDKTSFRCERGDTAGARLAPFGFVRFKNTEDSVPLLLPTASVQDMRKLRFNLSQHGFSVTSIEDSLAEAVESRMDARSDSIDELKDTADELEDSAASANKVDRPKLQKQADSVRTVMRALVDRMRADDAELDAIHHPEGPNSDSLSLETRQLADSIRLQVNRELERAGVRVRVKPNPVATPAPPTPPQ